MRVEILLPTNAIQSMKTLLMVFAALLSTSCVTMSKQAEETFKVLGESAIWAPVITWADGSTGHVDLNSFEQRTNGFSGWITTPNGWKKISVDCARRLGSETWTWGGEIKDLLVDYPLSKKAQNDGIVLLANKFCDHFSETLGTSSRFLLASTEGIWYRFAAETYRTGSVVTTVITNLVPPTANILAPEFSPEKPFFQLLEMDCSENKVRMSAPETWGAIRDRGTASEWQAFPDKTPLKAAQRLLCSDVTVQRRALPKEKSADMATSVNEAKTKCANLGFKPKSTAYGECVLKLSK